MPIQLPKEFTNIPLGVLWESTKIAKELLELSADTDDKKYWTGWHDCMCILLSDLTQRPTIKLDKDLSAIFESFRMEDTLRKMDEERTRDLGGPSEL